MSADYALKVESPTDVERRFRGKRRSLDNGRPHQRLLRLLMALRGTTKDADA